MPFLFRRPVQGGYILFGKQGKIESPQAVRFPLPAFAIKPGQVIPVKTLGVKICAGFRVKRIIKDKLPVYPS
jgi:hypothetical protein